MAWSPARTATLVAVPVALLAGLLVFWLLGGLPAGPGGATAGPGAGSGAGPGSSAGPGGLPAGRAAPGPQVTGPVTVAAPALDEPGATTCRALLSKLPEALRDRARRPVTAGAEQNAAYGDPPIVLSCGVAWPTVPKVAQLLVLSGVCWYAEGQVWTTVDRKVPVRVTVPTAYDPAGQWVVDLAALVADAVPPTDTTCLSTSVPPTGR